MCQLSLPGPVSGPTWSPRRPAQAATPRGLWVLGPQVTFPHPGCPPWGPGPRPPPAPAHSPAWSPSVEHGLLQPLLQVRPGATASTLCLARGLCSGRRSARQGTGHPAAAPAGHSGRTRLTLSPLPVAALPGAAGRRVPGPEPRAPGRLPGVRVLLPAGPRGADQAARLLLRHLDGSGGRPRLLVSVPFPAAPSAWGRGSQPRGSRSAWAAAPCVPHPASLK